MMYDHIKLQIPVEFADEGARDAFLARYGLTEADNSHGTWNNAANKDLPQYKGVYVKLRIKN